MKAVTFAGVEQIEVVERAEPEIRDPRDAIVRVEVAGLCGSDLHPYRGTEVGLDIGTVMGHEFVGEVVAVGPEVEKLGVGAVVMSPFSTSCGSCPRCSRGVTARCVDSQLFGWVENGKGLHGAQAELVRVPLADSTLVERPEGLTAEEALLTGDVLATGFAAVERLGANQAGTPIAVIGAGAVGLAAVLAARHLGYAPIFSVEKIAERMERAAALGAVPVPADVAAEFIRSHLGADEELTAVVEAVGGAETLRLASDLCAPGASLSSVGVHTETTLPIGPLDLYNRNLSLHFGRCSARAAMPRLAAMILEDRSAWPIAELITDRHPLDAARDLYRRFDQRKGGCIKALFTL